MQSLNFEILRNKWPELAELGASAECYAYSDPQSAMLKLRCFVEIIVNNIYHDLTLTFEKNWNLFDKLEGKEFNRIISRPILDKFHAIRIKGNKAIHKNKIDTDAVWLIKEAYCIACWIYTSNKEGTSESCKEFIQVADNGNKYDKLNETIKQLEETLEQEKQTLVNVSYQNNEKIEIFKNDNNHISNRLNLNSDEISKRISIDDIFADYNLTIGQTNLVKELNEFISDSNQNIFLLKGYAGTGKTFITKGLTEYFTSVGRNYIIAAPTGKAAKVIKEKTGSEAFTIHKTIYSHKDLKEYKESESDRTYKFYFNLSVNENSNDTIYIIDEASMISNIYSEMEFFRFGSGHLLNDLLKYINIDNNDHNKKIIFIGDNAQLPPVGMKFSPALDKDGLKREFGLKIKEFELTDVVRQKEESSILKSSINIRQSIENNVYNKLDIDISTSNISHLDYSDFISKYLEISNNKICKHTMVIAYTNASVKSYNQVIRKHFFDDINKINKNEKVILLSSSNNYEIPLSNGDFGLIKNTLGKTEHKSINLKKKNPETNIVEITPVDLYFKDVEIIFKDENDKLYLISCKIIENLLFSEKPNLNSDEHKAIYLDFIIRNPSVKPNTEEFKLAIKSDPYFNALRIKFGYAITCHKAQGSEWDNVILDCNYSHNKRSEDYYRWLYTAITRASKKLYTIDEPHITNFPPPPTAEETNSSASVTKSSPSPESDVGNNSFNIQDDFLLSIYYKVASIVAINNIKILDIRHYQYQEQYTFESNNEQLRVNIIYNGRKIISSINPLETNNLASLIKVILNPLKNHLISVEQNTTFTFSEIFLEEFYLALKDKLNKIIIVNIEHLNYMERYTFKRDNEIAIIDFIYNGRSQFTTTNINRRTNSLQLSTDILGAF